MPHFIVSAVTPSPSQLPLVRLLELLVTGMKGVRDGKRATLSKPIRVQSEEKSCFTPSPFLLRRLNETVENPESVS